MKWYIAARTSMANKVKEYADILKSNGHEISFDWYTIEKISDYSKNTEIAEKIIKALNETNIFVLISDQEGTDMYIELGSAITNQSKVYVVGKHNKRSLMLNHPRIIHLDTIEQVFKKENVNI